VLVAGGGPAGLMAARAAARAGARTILCEREPACGGELDFEAATIEGQPAAAWLAATLTELVSLGVRILTDTPVVAGSGGELIAYTEPGGLLGRSTLRRIRPRAFVIAMGAVEHPIAFVDNDKPGVMMLGAAERYMGRYGVRVGRSVVVYANHDRAYAAAARLVAGGIQVRAIVDTRADIDLRAGDDLSQLRRQLLSAGVECLNRHAVVAAEGRTGVVAARVASLERPATTRSISCDAILISGGWSPVVHAGLHEGGTRQYDASLSAFVASDQPEWRTHAGAAAGVLELGAVLADGHAAGVSAARRAHSDGSAGTAPDGRGDPEPRLVPFWRSPATAAGEKRQFIDFQNDVTVADLHTALADGFRDIEHVKRYTTLGIGTDQGRTSGLVGAAILAEIKGETLPEVGVSRSRPPYQPMTMRTIAGFRTGDAFRVARRTPLHEWHAAHGGVLDPMGLWVRPRFYRENGADAAQASIVEAGRVRSTGGVVDGSTLGKVEVAGPDAAAFLDYLYLTKASTIRVGRSKYMVNLREDGFVLDDGIVLRFADDRFIATTSSGHGGHMLSHFEHYRDTEWAGRAVTVTDVTEAWAVIAASGPNSREALSAVLGAEWGTRLRLLAHMDFATGQYAGHDLTVLRASFSGELAFELHCRPAIAVALWESLIGHGLQPYGLEALDILRVEKGYLTGSELSGQTTPHDLGMDGLVRLGNPCLGRDLLDRPGLHEATRPKLVGVRAVDGKSKFSAGAQITTPKSGRRACGYITSTVYSPALGEWIGLALVARSLATEGVAVTASDPLRGAETRLKITSPVHFDPAGERIKS